MMEQHYTGVYTFLSGHGNWLVTRISVKFEMIENINKI